MREGEHGGHIIRKLSRDDMEFIYTHLDLNKFGLQPNQYLIAIDEKGHPFDTLKWTGTTFQTLDYRPICSDYFGKVSPRNIEQRLAFDLLQDRTSTVKVLTGEQGVGKDFLMITHALYLMLKCNAFEKIIWIRNNVRVRNTSEIGALPGDVDDKIMPYAMVMADHLGGYDALRTMLDSHKIELMHLGFARGRDIRNSIIMCSEAENLTRDHVRLLLGRVADGSELWLNGDIRQTDAAAFIEDNGLHALTTRLPGQKLYGHVELKTIERSGTAALAALLN